MRERIDRPGMAALSAGHASVDFSSGSLPALLPFLADRFDLSYTLAAALMLASAVCSSLLQPAFGLWSDRRGAIWLLSAGVLVSGVGIALAAVSPTYWLTALLIVVSSLGIAAYHPEGSKFAAYVSGRRRASGMSLFSIGGNIGYALGALVTTSLVVALGLNGALLLLVPAAVVGAALVAVSPYLSGFAPAGGGLAGRHGEDRPRALSLLLTVIAFRSLAWFGLITFVPLWEVSLGHSKSYGNHLLAGMLLAGALGTLVAGPIGDRVGLRTVLAVSTAVTAPLIFVFVVMGGVVGSVALILVGPFVIGTFGITMVLSQEYLPNRIGMASGLSIGFSIGLGGVAAVALGAIADSVDLRTSFYVCAAAPLVGLLLTGFLPPARPHPHLEPEVAVP